MNFPSSTPFPILTFQSTATGEGTSPAALRDFLLRIVSDGLSDAHTSLKHEDFDQWTGLLAAISDHLLAAFPTIHGGSWVVLHEKTYLANLSLDIIHRILTKSTGLFDKVGRLAEKVLAHLVTLAYIIETRGDPDVPDDEDRPSPNTLKSRAIAVAIELLRYLGDALGMGGDEGKPSWELMGSIFTKCIEAGEGLLSQTSTLVLPKHVLLLREAGGEEPDASKEMEKPPEPSGIHIEDNSDAVALLCVLSEVLSGAIAPPPCSHPLIAPLALRVTHLVRGTFDSCISDQWAIPPLQRAGCLTRVLIVMELLRPWYFSGVLDGVYGNMTFRLLLYRLKEKHLESRGIMDALLSKLLVLAEASAAKANAFAILADVPKLEEGDTIGLGLAIAYISRLLLQLDIETANLLKAVFSNERFNDAASALLEAIESKLILADATDDHSMDVDSSEESAWRARVGVSLQPILFADSADWVRTTSDLSGEVFRIRVIESIAKRPYNSLSAGQRLSIGRTFSELPCLLFHDGEPHCRRLSGPALRVTAIYREVVQQLLEGGPDQVTSAVRRTAFDALAAAIKHDSLDCELVTLDAVSATLCRSLSDKDRGVRLSVGRATIELTRLYNKIGKTTYVRVERIFDTLYRLLEKGGDSVKETVLVSVGGIGRATDSDILGVTISCLISRLADPNPLLKGVAFTQLLSLEKHFKKKSYALIFPYIAQVAPFLVNRWLSQPALLLESCRFLSISPGDFIEATLPHTLPPLFGACDLGVLQKISKDLGTQPSLLFVKQAQAILSHVFLLQGPGLTNKALAFIASILTEATSGEQIKVSDIVGSYTVQLLGTLVNVLGDEDQVKVNAARQALQKVEKSLESSKGRRRQSDGDDLGGFLKLHMLGIISYMIDLLHDVQGKKSPQAKQQTLRSLGALAHTIGPLISGVAPQIMATLQAMVMIPGLSDAALDSWFTFLKTLTLSDAGAHAGPTSASMVVAWTSLSPHGRDVARAMLQYIVFDIGNDIADQLDDVVDLSALPELADMDAMLRNLRSQWQDEDKLRRILQRASSDNMTVVLQALRELRSMMTAKSGYFQSLATGDIFDPLSGRIVSVLFSAAARDSDGTDEMHLLAFECIGSLGALDPDRFEFGLNDSRIVVMKNFSDDEENQAFALHLIGDVLVGAFRSTSDIGHQMNLAYAIQELLKFCGFTSALVSHGSHASVPLRVRNRWNRLPKHMLEIATPLLEGRLSAKDRQLPDIDLPIYPKMASYREWMQLWTTYLITRVSGDVPKRLFNVFRAAIRNKDVTVAHYLLPHLALNVLISSEDEDVEGIRAELLAVLEDQVDAGNVSPTDKKVLSAQAVFILMDHLNKWVRRMRREIGNHKAEGKRRLGVDVEEQLLRVDSVLSSIDQNLMAKAAFQCKAYARSLMSFERHVADLKDRQADSAEIEYCYERLHEIYANIDEPDGMEGISSLIMSPTLEHQIREHESTGRWTSAQSCWELRLQQSPDNLDYHIGLLRCLRNLGHYDSLRTHVKGVLTRNPDWKPELAPFQVESAWMIGDWADVQSLASEWDAKTPSMVMTRLLLAMRAEEPEAIKDALSQARLVLGHPISASGAREYRHSYETVLNLHLVHEVEMIHDFASSLPLTGTNSSRQRHEILTNLSKNLTARLEFTLPSFRIREPILSMRRTAFGLAAQRYRPMAGEIGRSWSASAKIARKAGHWQTAYTAMLQAQEHRTPFSFVQSSKLLKATGEPLRALQELENAMRVAKAQGGHGDVIDLTEEDDESKQMKAKAEVLRCRWMNESDRFEMSDVQKIFHQAAEIWPKWESGWFYYGRFQDDCYNNLSAKDKSTRGSRMHVTTVRCFMKAIKTGSKFLYQTVSRLLTIWLDMGDNDELSKTDPFTKINTEIGKNMKHVPAYKWYIAFPQIVSRVIHKNPDVYPILSKLITMVIQEHPQQALWLFASVMKSNNKAREERGRTILDSLKGGSRNQSSAVPRLINECMAIVNQLLALCDYPIKDNSKLAMSMKKELPNLMKLAPSRLIIPLQESLTASLPPTSSSDSQHQPFPQEIPTFTKFLDEIEIMKSMAKPRKITIIGSNGQTYMFLGKPKDDLRKDARLMEFNGIINKLLKANSDSRRRQLHVRTYGVVTLNEECGFIQWVPNTIPIRPVLLKSYDARGIKYWGPEMSKHTDTIKQLTTEKEVAAFFEAKILPLYPPVLHEWFIETFPEPSAWLASRLTYARTSAVMCMVGFILGLGDRHCENILLDENTGAVVHVDFNCLFDKGKTMETPERVPFRLTQNMVDGLGVTGVEGVFRIACENTLQLLRDNKDTLMSVLDAFVHDPLVEWEDEKRRIERAPRRGNAVSAAINLKKLAKNALQPIEKKLNGVYQTSRERPERELSTSNLVQMLIQEATSSANLGRMYAGWAPWH